MHVLAKMRRLCAVGVGVVVFVFILFLQNTLKHWRQTSRMRLIFAFLFATTSTPMSHNSNGFMNDRRINDSETYTDNAIQLQKL